MSKHTERVAGGADIGFRCLRCEAQGMRFYPQILTHLEFGAPQTSNYDVCATRDHGQTS
jgi:hypothetical protein